MISVKQLKKVYPGVVPVVALRDVNLEIKDGEFIAIMGRSGSGKSTLLHQLGLLDIPTEGGVSIDGDDMLKLSDKEKTSYRLKNLGYVFQEYALIREFTALENVYLPAMALGTDEVKYKKRATELLTLVGLAERVHHYPFELSGGEQQRVAIARALINQPKIIFADEPTATLDSESSRVILELFQRLNKEFGQTIIMITHEPDDKEYTNRVVWLHDGMIEKVEAVRSRKKL